MEQEQVMWTTAGALDVPPPPVETAGDIDLDVITDVLDSVLIDDAVGDEHRRQLRRAVAALPQSAIGEMHRRELIFAIRTAELPWLADSDDRLDYADRPTLERLAFLARRVCRRQLLETNSHRPNGKSNPADELDGRPTSGRLPGFGRAVPDSFYWREKPR